MKYQTLYDLMDLYEEDELDLPDAHAADAGRVRRLVHARLRPQAVGGPVPKAKKRPGRRVLIAALAAAMAALLGVTAYAVYQRAMADRVVESSPRSYAADGSAILHYSAVGANPDDQAGGAAQYAAYADGKGTYYSVAGRNREYEALREWTDFFFSSTAVLAPDDLLDVSDPHRLLYGAGYGVLAEKMDAIAEKYGLRLLQSVEVLGSEQAFFETLGTGPFYPVAEHEDHATLLLYDEGSFQASGLAMSGAKGGTLGFNACRAMRGTFTDFLVLGGDPAQADFETYVTDAGTEVDIALEDTDAFFFADLDSCHVTFWFNDGRDGGLTLADMEALADGVDFAALDQDCESPVFVS